MRGIVRLIVMLTALKQGKKILSSIALFAGITLSLHAGSNSVTVPYSGRIAVNNTNFTGAGQFKFAIVDNGTVVNPPTRRAAATAILTGLCIVTGKQRPVS